MLNHTGLRAFIVTIALVLAPFVARAQQIPAEYQQVLSALGKTGDFKDNVLKLNIPRNDVKVTVAGVSTPTPFGFGGWIAMTKGDGGHEVPRDERQIERLGGSARRRDDGGRQAASLGFGLRRRGGVGPREP